MHLRQRAARILANNKGLLIFFGVMLLFRSAVADWMVVPTGSMNPTIVEGDRILVDKNVYGWRVPFTTVRLTQGSDPRRGDIVIFDSPEDGTTLVKRVIGLPGDSIEMRDERLLINGVALEYGAEDLADVASDSELPRATQALQHRYSTEKLADAAHAIMLLPARPAARSFGPIVVPAGEYLVLGDSRDNSKDSRYIGFVPRSSIVGRAFRVAYSLDAERWYRPRADRVLTPLE
jgi:signal peptidase I